MVAVIGNAFMGLGALALFWATLRISRGAPAPAANPAAPGSRPNG